MELLEITWPSLSRFAVGVLTMSYIPSIWTTRGEPPDAVAKWKRNS